MSHIQIKYPPGATPLDPNEMNGLIPDYITTQSELNTLERQNILEATRWAIGRRHPDYLNVTFCLRLHKRMLNDVWTWAGEVRGTVKNIGVAPDQIRPGLKNLFDDVTYWLEEKTYSTDEVAVRFHHRLVSIHVFPNGNGRHARLMTDILLEQNGERLFSWGRNAYQEIIEAEGKVRSEYILALQAADAKSYGPLLKFVRS